MTLRIIVARVVLKSSDVHVIKLYRKMSVSVEVILLPTCIYLASEV